jgi:hypothetical protein
MPKRPIELTGNRRIRLYKGKPTSGFEPGTLHYEGIGFVPKESAVGLCRQRASVSGTLEGTRLDNPIRPPYGPRRALHTRLTAFGALGIGR